MHKHEWAKLGILISAGWLSGCGAAPESLATSGNGGTSITLPGDDSFDPRIFGDDAPQENPLPDEGDPVDDAADLGADDVEDVEEVPPVPDEPEEPEVSPPADEAPEPSIPDVPPVPEPPPPPEPVVPDLP